jgi:hypothetical protein
VAFLADAPAQHLVGNLAQGRDPTNFINDLGSGAVHGLHNNAAIAMLHCTIGLGQAILAREL